jgi:hypothetical protein
LVSGSDVIAEPKIRLWEALSLEEAAIGVPSDQIVEPATHAATDRQSNRKTKSILVNADSWGRAL